MPNNEKLITTDTLYTFKLEQDLQNLEKFKLKSDSTDLKGAVRYDAAQVLEDTQKQQARANIGAADESVVIRFDKAQDLTPEQKAQARANIGAGTGNGAGSGVTDYNELANRPCYGEAFHSYFDGSETPNVDKFTPLGDTVYKVSDLTPTKEQMFSADIYINGELRDKLTEENIILSGEKNGEVGLVAFMRDGYCILVAYTTETVDLSFQGQSLEFTAPSEGIYIAISDITQITFEIEYGEVKRLDDMYIPKNIPRLDDSGLISAKNLPSYVDDVIEGYMIGDVNLNFYSEKDADGNYIGLIVGEKGKIYIDLDTGNTYRWSGSQYVRMNPPEYTLASNEDIYALFNK